MDRVLRYADESYELQPAPKCDRHVNSIVIHTAAHPSWSAEQIREYHMVERNYRDIGYHWIVEKDGSVVAGRPESQVGAHVTGWNTESIGVCFAGHGDVQPWTDAQRVAGVALVAELTLRHSVLVENVYGHRELNQGRKSCPGTLVDLDAFRNMVSRRRLMYHQTRR